MTDPKNKKLLSWAYAPYDYDQHPPLHSKINFVFISFLNNGFFIAAKNYFDRNRNYVYVIATTDRNTVADPNSMAFKLFKIYMYFSTQKKITNRNEK